ncbi:MAG TPA: cytochrome c peroxidase [Bacteriovoracaceae bacterium]|nr:cytochrome c peroxidase [Bacteriovoracaceae bacterium]
MTLVIILLLSIPLSFSQVPNQSQVLSNFIRQFRFKPLGALQKRPALFQLGEKLFNDQQLSGKSNISCQSCHSPQAFTADTLPLGVGEGSWGEGQVRRQQGGALLARHTPALFNLGFSDVTTLFWDGRVMKHPQGGWLTPEPKLNGPAPELTHLSATLDSLLAVQALFPIANPEEMLGAGSKKTTTQAWEEAAERIFKGPFGNTYLKQFQAAYPGVVNFNIGHIANAIAEFQRHAFHSANTPWDNFLRGNTTGLSPRMLKGGVLFFTKAACINCHIGDHFTRFVNFQNIGIPQVGPGVRNGDDKGRYEVSGRGSDLYKFRVPPLRNVAMTAPYMHSGVFKNLWEVIAHYNNSQTTFSTFEWDPSNIRYRDLLVLDTNGTNQDNRERSLSGGFNRALALTAEEQKDLYCFVVGALTDLQFQSTTVFKGVINEVSDCTLNSRP